MGIIETATQAGTFQTLLTAIQTVGVEDMLNAPGPFTVLAPTDEAFSKLPAGALDHLLQDQPTLKKVVLYHVLFGDVRSDDLAEIDEAETMEGSIIAINHTDSGVQVNDASVLQTDILTDNGVIHVIDAVLMPAMVAGET